MQGKVFISYRRSDSASIVGRLHDRLVARLGHSCVFRDVNDIAVGTKFKRAIVKQIDKSAVVLVVVGERWYGETEDGKRRIDSPKDLVRCEVARALASDALVIPVLVGSQQTPLEHDLPVDIALVSHLSAACVREDPDFDTDVDRLMQVILGALERYRVLAEEGGGVGRGEAVLEALNGPDAGRVWRLERDRYTFGRSPDADIVLNDYYVSRSHGDIRWDGARGGYSVNSVHPAGVRVNQKAVESSAVLCDGDIVSVGGVALRFKRA